MRLARILLLLSLIGIVFTFVKSEQFASGTTKITSLDYSADGKWLAVGQNHALEKVTESNQPYLGELSRSVFVVNAETRRSHELIREPLPLERIGDPEWLRILGQLPSYDGPKLPFSPVQFLPESKKLAVFKFETNSIDAFDLDTKSSEVLCAFPTDSEFTLGWFRVVDDEISVIVEGDDLELSRYLMKEGKLDEQLPLGRPFYSNSVQLSLGPFLPVRMLPHQLKLPSPTYGVSLHPERDELAISSVLQVLLLDFSGEKIDKLYNKMKIGSIAVYQPNGKRMLSVFHNIIRIIDLDKLATVARITHEEKMITALAMLPDSSRFATGDNSGVVRIWDGETGDLVSKIRLGASWMVDWRVPYFLGFVWATVAFLVIGIGSARRGQRQSQNRRDEQSENEVDDSATPDEDADVSKV